MSAGTGVLHAEHNRGGSTLRLLQVWLFPDRQGLDPGYGDHRFAWEERRNRWLLVAAGPGDDAPITVHQDARVSALELDAGRDLGLRLGPDRQAYLLQVEGSSSVGGVDLDERDALEIVGEDVVVAARTTSHIFVIEMARPA
jgi:redox-sensitive bicupin YhaK (pirin superfamily)